MKHTEKELQLLKEEVNQMWKLVLSQLEKSKQAFLNSDIELAREIASREKRVDAFELKIDSDCENYIALYSPVAVDLRLVLSLIKISSTLERIGDFAEGIARHVIDDDCNKISPQIIEELQMEKMFDTLISMLSDSFVALESENTKISGKILAKDNEVDTLYHNSLNILTNYISSMENEKLKAEKSLSTFNSQLSTQKIYCGLKLMLLIRKLERIGDHCSNIVEEIVFYVDAKVLKHGKKNGKLKVENEE
ncbi:phosphate transport system regulatory protein PhoU [Paludibacter sp. 221]|uniref:phosphate signaling complex protein PhoU n=1 Tax=Paludibacter sp. 221 TaxID=2302939 RepID=UPI0013D5F236|nr:phosphate signaling complex protein PhoU [Paludibacter sp. 221]NDV46296.1 phosphate transport system regulatory protein PhoU [Paludibacter sp. 221]